MARCVEIILSSSNRRPIQLSDVMAMFNEHATALQPDDDPLSLVAHSQQQQEMNDVFEKRSPFWTAHEMMMFQESGINKSEMPTRTIGSVLRDLLNGDVPLKSKPEQRVDEEPVDEEFESWWLEEKERMRKKAEKRDDDVFSWSSRKQATGRDGQLDTIPVPGDIRKTPQSSRNPLSMISSHSGAKPRKSRKHARNAHAFYTSNVWHAVQQAHPQWNAIAVTEEVSRLWHKGQNGERKRDVEEAVEGEERGEEEMRSDGSRTKSETGVESTVRDDRTFASLAYDNFFM